MALAWLMKYSPAILPIPGATRIETIQDCVTSVNVTLSDADFDYLSNNLPEQAEYSSELLPKPPYRS
jgi:aryl-alcohol dehydrogenase-like predicted oxidoreductase